MAVQDLFEGLRAGVLVDADADIGVRVLEGFEDFRQQGVGDRHIAGEGDDASPDLHDFIADLPNVPSFPEFYETVKGAKPEGLAYQLQQSLMNAKVMLSKAVMLPKGMPDNIRDVYIQALKGVTSEPDMVAALPRETAP